MRELVGERCVVLGACAEDWTQAVRAGAELLVREGAVTPGYVEAIFDSFAANGGYMIVVPGVVLAHARPEHGALRTALSVLTLAEPVCYDGDPGQPLSVIVTFAATDGGEHMAVLQSLARVLVDPDALARLASSRDVGVVRGLLSGAGR